MVHRADDGDAATQDSVVSDQVECEPDNTIKVNEMIARLHRGDPTAVAELVELEQSFIVQQAESMAGRKFSKNTPGSGYSSVPQSVNLELLRQLKQYQRRNTAAGDPSMLDATAADEPQRAELFSTLTNREQFRHGVILAIQRHLDRTAKSLKKTRSRFRPMSGESDRLAESVEARPDENLPQKEQANFRELLSTAKLTPYDQHLLEMRYLEELSETLIAERLGKSQPTISRDLSKAREKLRKAQSGEIDPRF